MPAKMTRPAVKPKPTVPTPKQPQAGTMPKASEVGHKGRSLFSR